MIVRVLLVGWLCWLYPGVPLLSQSYSNHWLDNGLYRKGGGKSIQVQPRIGQVSDQAGWNWDTSIYITGEHNTQRGGKTEDRIARYSSHGLSTVEIGLRWGIGENPGSQQGDSTQRAGLALSSRKGSVGLTGAYLLLTPSIAVREDFHTERHRQTLYNGEALLGTNGYLWGVDWFLQGGRGFQRTDRYGLYLARIGEFLELGVYGQGGQGGMIHQGLRLIGGQWNPDPIYSGDWRKKESSRTWGGVSWSGGWKILYGSIEWNLFQFWQMRDSQIAQETIPNYTPAIVHSPAKNGFLPQGSLVAGERDSISGAEVRIPFNSGWFGELGGLQLHGQREGGDTIRAEKSHRAYAKWGWENARWLADATVFYQDRLGVVVTPSNNRLVGGQGSFLLSYDESRIQSRPSNSSLQILGIGLAYIDNEGWGIGESEWSKGFQWGSRLQSGQFRDATGVEGILYLSWESQGNFWIGSIAYARIQPYEKADWFAEVISVQPYRDYVKIFFSAGLVF